MSKSADLIRVGFFCHGAWPWARQTPGNDGIYGQCQFIFNGQGPFDYVVVYDGISSPLKLMLAKERTIFVCSEPMNVKRYNPGFVGQFGHIISADPELQHASKVSIQAGLPWHYGIKTAQPHLHNQALRFSQIEAAHHEKVKTISVICSNKNFTPEHRRRLAFVEALKKEMGDKLDVFGRGFREVDDKADVLDAYKYHVALENCDFDDYWTEKIADPFLAGCFPFYWGCKNLERYFPPDSFIRLDLDKPEEAARIIAAAITDNVYEKRTAELAEARRRVLHDNNLFAMIEREILAIEDKAPPRLGFTRLRQEFYFYPKPEVVRLSILNVLRKWPWLFNLLRDVYYNRDYYTKDIPQRTLAKLSEFSRHCRSLVTDSFYRNHQIWLWRDGENTLRYDYKLGPDSVVFDVGGYEGLWAQEIHRRFSAQVYVFEPVKSFIERIRLILGNNPAIHIMPYGLSGADEECEISLLEDSSTVCLPSSEREMIQLRDVSAVLRELNISSIDLLKINIEGGEFPLLERMIATGDILKVKDIQVQFHPFVKNGRARYADLCKALAKTHRLTWRFYFVWENWTRRDDV